MSNVPSLNRLKWYKTGVLNGPISNIFIPFVSKRMSHKEVISLFEPGTVPPMLLIANKIILSSQSHLNLGLVDLLIPLFD